MLLPEVATWGSTGLVATGDRSDVAGYSISSGDIHPPTKYITALCKHFTTKSSAVHQQLSLVAVDHVGVGC